MTADIENLVLEHLRAIRADMADVKLRVTQIDVQLSAMGQQLAGLTSVDFFKQSKIKHQLIEFTEK